MTQHPFTRDAVETFLYQEARLADEHRYDEWLSLWQEEGVRYWIPNGIDDPDPARHISIAYDDRARLEDRIFRLKGKSAHAQRPKSRMRRLISNVEVFAPDATQARVECNFLLAEVRSGAQDLFNGRFIYELRVGDGGAWRIAGKKVLLVNNDEFIDNLTFLL